MWNFEALRDELYSAVISDVMDDIGLLDRAMRPFIRPVVDTMAVMGRARTGLFVDVYSVAEGSNPYEIEIALIDDLKPGDIAVLACNGPTDRIAPWGELLTTASMARGASGCVTDGLVRDLREIKTLGFPVFHGGIGPLDSRGRSRMIEMDTPVMCAGVRVRTGDIVFADIDGVVVIPQEHAEKVIDKARIKASNESKTREELRNGKLLREVYEKYGVL